MTGQQYYCSSLIDSDRRPVLSVIATHNRKTAIGYQNTGKRTADGRSVSWKISWSAFVLVVPVPRGAPDPRLRAKRGCAPLEICTRNRWPRRKQCPVGHISMRIRRIAGALGSERSRISPSLTFSDRPRSSTSQRRAKKSVCGRLDRTNRSADTGPTTLRSAGNVSLL